MYGINPDIESTALMISTMSWIITKILVGSKINKVNKKSLLGDEDTSFKLSGYSNTEPNAKITKVVEFVIPHMLKAVDHLQTET